MGRQAFRRRKSDGTLDDGTGGGGASKNDHYGASMNGISAFALYEVKNNGRPPQGIRVLLSFSARLDCLLESTTELPFKAQVT